jgi:hypothetical protein
VNKTIRRQAVVLRHGPHILQRNEKKYSAFHNALRDYKHLYQGNQRINMGTSIFFTAVMIRAFRSAKSRGNGGTYWYVDPYVARI